MKNILTIFNREIRAYFNSVIAYIFIVVFVLISAGLFMTQFFLMASADMRMFFYYLPIILCVFLPAVTMRLWAEDRKGNTLELLLTFPVKTHELVLGKFLASFVFYIVSLAATLTVPLMVMVLGDPDKGAIVCQYIGAVFIGSLFLALGIFVSGLCEDQIVSFIVAMMACFGIFLLGTEFTAGSIDGWIPGFGSFLKTAVGCAQHFVAFQKGVFDLRDILYFVIGSAIFLVLNAFWLDSRLRPKAKTVFTTTAAISFGIFILINFIFSDMPIGRLDMTQGKIYTTSAATGDIMRSLKAPVTVKLYISPADKMPTGMKTLERDIRDKLDEFKVAARGNFDYKVFQMEAANVATGEESLEKSVDRKGIRPFQVQSIEADEVGVKLIYSAISIAYKEKEEEIIPRITPDDLVDLEYSLVSKVYRMTLDKKPAVALVAPYREKDIDPQMKAFLASMGQGQSASFREDEYEFIPQILEYEGYKTSRIRLSEDEPIPEGINTLVVIEPEDLNDRQRFEINRFLVNGGSVFLAAQKYLYQYSPMGQMGIQVVASDLRPGVNDLLKVWGLGISDNFLMDTQVEVVSLTGGQLFGIFEVSSPVKLPVQLRVVAEQMNKDISITSQLSMIFYLWGSALTVDAEKIKSMGLGVRTLFSSSEDSWEVPYHGGPLLNEDFAIPARGQPAASPRGERKSLPLAVFVEGQFPNAYEGKDIPAWPKKEGEAEQAPEKKEEKTDISPKPGKLILTGCTEVFRKELFRQASHAPFFINSIDALTLGEKLIGIRTKEPATRALPRVSSPAKAAWRFTTTFLVPVILCVIGGMRIVIRKRLKYSYMKAI